MKKILVWFRNDLRVYDNTALYQACISKENHVIALFIDTPIQSQNHNVSYQKISFMHHNLISLEKELFKLNIVLYYHKTTDFINSIEYLIYFCEKHHINNMFYNYQYEINERHRDYLVKIKLSQKNIVVKGFHDSLLVSEKQMKNSNNTTYKKFYFFKKKIIQHLKNNIPHCFPIPLKRVNTKKYLLHQFKLKPLTCYFNKEIFPIGEQSAINRLQNFCMYKFNSYSHERNFPFLSSTSMLSPYLSSGIISSRQCLMMCLKIKGIINLNKILYSSWINEILWREFYYHLLIGFPKLSKLQALVPWEKNINWLNNIKYFNAWKKGNTGFPIIDAGMRQLKKLGWMHNRLRMITASFLVKNMLIDWRKGEKYFMSQLIDGDLALNNGGWQWAASIGTDTSSYIRIFNPWNQSKIFDKLGLFIKMFLPELKDVPEKYIHNPHEWAKRKNYKLDYPTPIIDYFNSRENSLLIFNKAKLDFKKRSKNS